MAVAVVIFSFAVPLAAAYLVDGAVPEGESEQQAQKERDRKNEADYQQRARTADRLNEERIMNKERTRQSMRNEAQRRIEEVALQEQKVAERSENRARQYQGGAVLLLFAAAIIALTLWKIKKRSPQRAKPGK